MGPCSKCHDCRPASLPATTTDSGSGLFTVMECHSGTYGRHLVASRDLAAGEVVFAEPPLAVGPWSSDAPLCVACLEATCDNALDICGGCGLDICLGCSHDGEECAALSRMRGLRGLSRGIKYPVLTILRMLRLRLANPEAWQRLNYLSSGSQTSDQRRQHHLFKKIAECLAGTFTAEEVVSMIGIRYTNAKSVGNGCVAIYPTFSLMNNDCSRANTSHFVDGHTKEIVLRATDFIARGDELTVCSLHLAHPGNGCLPNSPITQLSTYMPFVAGFVHERPVGGPATTEIEDLAELAIHLHLREVPPKVGQRDKMRVLRGWICLSDNA